MRLQNLPRPGAKRSNFTLVALTNTGALWGYAADVNGVPAPTLVATTVPWGRSAPITADAVLRQPGDEAELPAGGNKPPGFWSGGVSRGSGDTIAQCATDALRNTDSL
jgi:hypothetical protein